MPTDAFKQLVEELKTIEAQIEENIGDPIWQRIMIRSTFASIEALVSAMMHAARPGIAEMSTRAASTHEEQHRLFFEVCALSDMSYFIKDNGHIDLRSLKADFKAKVLFAIRMLAKSKGIDLDPTQVEGWEKFREAIKIRNRITHPSKSEDLVTSQSDYKTVVTALQWIVICNHRACGGTAH